MLQSNELLAIRRKDISIYTDHMTIFLIKRKNDQYREGHTVYLKKPEKVMHMHSLRSGGVTEASNSRFIQNCLIGMPDGNLRKASTDISMLAEIVFCQFSAH